MSKDEDRKNEVESPPKRSRINHPPTKVEFANEFIGCTGEQVFMLLRKRLEMNHQPEDVKLLDAAFLLQMSYFRQKHEAEQRLDYENDFLTSLVAEATVLIKKYGGEFYSGASVW